MRIVKGKIPSKDVELCKEMASRYGIDEPDFVMDLYSVFRSGGRALPTASDMLVKMLNVSTRMRPTDALNQKILNRQRALENIVLTLSSKWPTGSPLRCTEAILIHMRASSTRSAVLSCGVCPLMSQCKFGQQLATITGRYSADRHPLDWKLPAHKDCPLGLAGMSPAEFRASMVAIAAGMVNPYPPDFSPSSSFGAVSPAGLSTFLPGCPWAGKEGSPATFTGGSFPTSLMDFALQKLSISEMAVFALAKKFGKKLGLGTQAKDKPTEVVSNEDKNKLLENPSEAVDATPEEQVLDDDLFMMKVAKKSIHIRRFSETDEEVNLFYLLLDVSGSMQAGLSTSVGGIFTRGGVAAALAIATAERVRTRGGIMFGRCFDVSATELQHAEDDTGFRTFETWLFLASFNGGGTCIQSALHTAASDIENARNDPLRKIGKAEILLISDGVDQINPSEVKSFLAKAKTKLHFVHILDKNEKPMKQFEDVCDTYYKTDLDSADLDDILSVVKEVT